MRCLGAYFRINVPSLWHREQTAMMAWPAGLPLKPVDGALARTLSVSFGLPPWQSTQVKPRSRCTSVAPKSFAGADSTGEGCSLWHVSHPEAGAGWAEAGADTTSTSAAQASM